MRFQVVFPTIVGLTILIFGLFSSPIQAESIETRQAFQQGYQLFNAGEYYQSINSFKIVTGDSSYPLLDYSYYYIAKSYQQTHYYKEALQVYEMVVKYFKNSTLAPKALFEMANIKSNQEDYNGAVLLLRKLITQFPNHESIPEARFRLGINLEKLGEKVEAARVYRNLDLLYPNSDFAEKALEQLDKIAKKISLAGYEAPAATIYNLGIKYFIKGDYAKSKSYFTRLEKFYKRSSFYDESLLMLGRVHLRKEKLNLAVKYFKKSINQNKDSKPEALFYLGITYAYLDSPQAAIQTLEKLVATLPKSHLADDALYYLGGYYNQVGNTEQALVAYEKLISSYPNSDLFSETLWLIGNLYYKQDNGLAAYENFSQAFKLPPEKASDRLLFWAAKCADKIGKTEEAIAAYKTTIARYDHSYYGYQAREKLKKYGIQIKVNTVPDVSETIEKINGNSIETANNEQKYRELLTLGLGDEAAEEASLLEEKLPPKKKDKALLAKYHAYILKGKYAKPIWFADREIEKAMFSGSLSQVNPRLWRFSYPRGYWDYIEKYAKEYDLDPYLICAVIREESRFKSRALSRSRAHGLMQIIPSTGRKLSRLLGMRYSSWKLYDPRVNIQLGTYFLAALIKRFDGNIALALAGYNGGPSRVERWLKNYKELDLDEFLENIPLRETRNYVKKVLKSYYGYKRTYSSG